LEYLTITANAIGAMALEAGATNLPLPIQALGIDRELLEITVTKRGSGIQIYYERKEESMEPKAARGLRFRAMFWEGRSIVFGTGAPASNAEISARLESITASWLGDHFGPSWQVRLSAEPKTSDLGDEIYATVLREDDDSWEGIRRIPGLPSCAAPLTTSIKATREEKAVSLIRYAWGANWPIKGTIALIMGVGTEQASEFSVTYELARTDVGPSWEHLWESMWRAVQEDAINLRGYVSRERLDYLVSCEKFNQSICILWRQNLANGELPQIPQDHELPVYSIYGSKAELKMRQIERLGIGVNGIVQRLHGTDIQVIPNGAQRHRTHAWSSEADIQAINVVGRS
jgi:hypothetical protein